MNIKLLKQLLFLPAMLILFTACTKDEIKPQLEDGKSTVINDLPGDVGNTVGSGKEFAPFYFSFKTGAKIEITKKSTTEWDISFTKEYNSYVTPNNPVSNPGSTGKGVMLVVNQAYDQVKEAPADTEFTNNAIASAGWDSGAGNGWYFYELKTHIAVPVKNRTYILRTAEGKYAKLQMISMYKGAPATVSDLNWPAPYFTFRYFVQQDGSRNLSTKD